MWFYNGYCAFFDTYDDTDVDSSHPHSMYSMIKLAKEEAQATATAAGTVAAASRETVAGLEGDVAGQKQEPEAPRAELTGAHTSHEEGQGDLDTGEDTGANPDINSELDTLAMRLPFEASGMVSDVLKGLSKNGRWLNYATQFRKGHAPTRQRNPGIALKW